MSLWLAVLGCSDPTPKTKPYFGGEFTIDLDGDRRPEVVRVDYEQVRIGAITTPVPKIQIHEPPVLVIDIDRDDPLKELVIQAVNADGNGVWHILIYLDNQVALQSIDVSTPPEILGDGVLRTRYSSCGETSVTDWARERGRLIQTRTETIGIYNAALCSG